MSVLDLAFEMLIILDRSLLKRPLARFSPSLSSLSLSLSLVSSTAMVFCNGNITHVMQSLYQDTCSTGNSTYTNAAPY